MSNSPIGEETVEETAEGTVEETAEGTVQGNVEETVEENNEENSEETAEGTVEGNVEETVEENNEENSEEATGTIVEEHTEEPVQNANGRGSSTTSRFSSSNRRGGRRFRVSGERSNAISQRSTVRKVTFRGASGRKRKRTTQPTPQQRSDEDEPNITPARTAARQRTSRAGATAIQRGVNLFGSSSPERGEDLTGDAWV